MKSTWILLVSLIALLTAAPAPARSGTDVGQVGAVGRGSVAVHASGIIEFRLIGEGVLVIQDVDEHDVLIDGDGEVHVTDEGALRVENFTGDVRVRGHGIRAGFRRGPVALHARGHGRAFLRGQGRYRTADVTGNWTHDGTHVNW